MLYWATGYIGGDTLYALYKAHPEYSYTTVVRTPEKGKLVKDAFPGVRIVQGDNDSSDLLKEEAAQADIVIPDASDHENAAKSIAAGLKAGHTKANPGFWLHTGGTGILTYFDSSASKFGEESDKQFNDFSGVDELVNLPHEAFHRNVDEIVLEAGKGDGVHTAIVCPPTIYGEGRGPSLTRGRQVYELAKTTLSIKKGPIIGGGRARWNNIHVHDLADAYVLLVEAAAAKNTSPELWGDKGYYFTENGEHYWGELAERISKCAAELGFIDKAETEQMGEEKAKETAGFEAISWGWNSRGKAERLGRVLGWTPKQGSLEDEVPTIVKSEHARMQKG
ncbi:hypothetical protein MBLNU459_g5154t1 [Dothideomycetes sp. NU459]